LGAPVGSVLVGTQALIESATRWRKVTGGGWRQAGMLAAACMHALDHHVQRLTEDHARAARMADALRELPGLDVLGQHTNMVFIGFAPERLDAFKAHVAQQQIRMSIGYLPSIRLVTHLDVDDEGVERVVDAMRAFFV
jgi:threonine aldolase